MGRGKITNPLKPISINAMKNRPINIIYGHIFFLTVTNMKENGEMEKNMGRVHTLFLMVTTSLGNGKREKLTVKELTLILMEISS